MDSTKQKASWIGIPIVAVIFLGVSCTMMDSDSSSTESQSTPLRVESDSNKQHVAPLFHEEHGLILGAGCHADWDQKMGWIPVCDEPKPTPP